MLPAIRHRALAPATLFRACRSHVVVWPAAICLAFAPWAHPAAAQDADADGRTRIIVLHDNDLHFTFNHLDRVRDFIEQVRRDNEHVFLLNAGDLFVRHAQRWPVGAGVEWYAENARRMIRTMNELGYDAAALGNHELDFVDGWTRDALQLAEFPLLSANVEVATDAFIQPAAYTVLETSNGVRLGVLGLSVVNFDLPSGLSVASSTEAVQEHADLLEEVDVAILLTHLGIPEEVLLANLFGHLVDVIIGGHTHTLLPEAIQVNGVLVGQVLGHDHDPDPERPMYLGKMILVVEKGRVVEKCGRVYRIDAEGARLAGTVERPWRERYRCPGEAAPAEAALRNGVR